MTLPLFIFPRALMLSLRACLPLRARHLASGDAPIALPLVFSLRLRSSGGQRCVEQGRGRVFPRIRPRPLPHLSVNASYHPRGHCTQAFPCFFGLATTRALRLNPSDLRSRRFHDFQSSHGGIRRVGNSFYNLGKQTNV